MRRPQPVTGSPRSPSTWPAGTREHPDLRHGASIRAAIDLASLLAAEAAVLRDEPDPVLLRCLVCAAFTGRVRLRPTATRSACDLVMDLFTGLSAETADGVAVLLADAGEGALAPALDETGAAPAEAGRDGADQGGRDSRSRADPEELPGLERAGGSGEAGRSRSVPMMVRDSPVAVRSAVREMDRVAEDPLADFWQAVRKAAELVLRVNGTLDSGSADVQGKTLRSTPWRPGEPGELDLVTTVANVAARGGLVAGHDLRVLRRAPEQADYLILIDHSGSMVGRKLSLAAVLAAAVAQLSAAGRTRYGVLAFDEQVSSVKDLDAENDISEVVERILLLPEGKATDLARALRAAIEITGDLPAARTILISDCMPTRGMTGFRELAGLASRVPSLHICYLDDRQPVIELHGSGTRLNLYEWWARRWVGDQRVYTVDRLDDLDLVVEGLSAEEPQT